MHLDAVLLLEAEEEPPINTGRHLSQPVNLGRSLSRHDLGALDLPQARRSLLGWQTLLHFTPELTNDVLGERGDDLGFLLDHKRGRGQSPFGMPPERP